MNKFVLYSGLILTVFSCSQIQVKEESKSFSSEPYLEDFEILKTHLSQSYANLEYLIQHYEIDPFEINRTTTTKIKNSNDEQEAIDVLKSFAKTFRDGHFKLVMPKPDKEENTERPLLIIPHSASAEDACNALGFSSKKDFGFKFPRKGVTIRESGEGEFPYIIIQENNLSLGVIRVADFRETSYGESCRQAWESFRVNAQSECDKVCQQIFQYEFLRSVLVDNFYKTLEKVRDLHIDALMVDLTDNGGGSNWVEDITALLTTAEIKCGKSGFVKHPHHVKNFENMLVDLKMNGPNDLTKIAAMEANIKIANEQCDRTPLWTIKDYELKCSLVGFRQGESCKYSEKAFPGKTKYNGELFLLVNENTASAAEDIVARHLDSKTATVVGNRTYGAGCGYMNGGIKLRLPNSGLEVKVPDCVRAREDGANEVTGLAPDLKLDMSRLKSDDFLKLLVDKVSRHLTNYP